MTDILHIVFSVFAVFFIIEAALYQYIKGKRSKLSKGLNKKINEYLIAYLIIFLLFSGYLYFFEEQSFYLECQKDAMTCTYSHTTYFNKKMSVIERYDISRTEFARAKKNSRIGRHGGKTFYTVELVEKDKSFSFTPHCNNLRTAEKEAIRFNRFLRGTEKLYTFRKNPSSDSFGSTIGFMACLFAIFLEARLFWHLVEAAVREHKRRDNHPNKEDIPPQNDVIQRNL